LKRRSLFGTLAALGASVVLAGTVLASGPFTNGSFETGNFVPFQQGVDFARLVAPDNSIDGWNVSNGSVDWVGTYWQAADGTRSIDLDGNETQPGTISQTFDTHVGSTYVVTFALSGNPDAGPALKTMTVDIDGGAPTAYSYDTGVNLTTRAAMHYLTKGYSFVATDLETTLNFTSTTDGGYGAVIDNIVITETLQTGAQCKNSGWKTMVDKLSNPFKNQGDCVSYFATGEKNLASATN
jgi:choice-of-anchor C domain-containing protein